MEENPEMLYDYNRWKANLESYRLEKAWAKPDCEDLIPNTWDAELKVIKD